MLSNPSAYLFMVFSDPSRELLTNMRQPKNVQNSRSHFLKCKKKQPNHHSCRASSLHQHTGLDRLADSHLNQLMHLLLANHGPTPPPCCIRMRQHKHTKSFGREPPWKLTDARIKGKAVKTKLAAASCTWKFLSKAYKLSVDSPVHPLAPETKSRLTVEAADAASLCCCHDTLNGPFWHGPS